MWLKNTGNTIPEVVKNDCNYSEVKKLSKIRHFLNFWPTLAFIGLEWPFWPLWALNGL